MMKFKVNSKEYWEERFRSLDWDIKNGPLQSLLHAKHFVKYLDIDRNFSGRICDFGCAEGDACVIYKKYFPKAELIGIDFSECAIERARAKHGKIANFICGTFDKVPDSDIIVSAHVFEHLYDADEVFDSLIKKCKRLFIIVPYKEEPGFEEHFRIYDEKSFKEKHPVRLVICKAGFNMRFLEKLYHIYIKNILRPIFGRKIIRGPKQIIFEFKGKIEHRV